MKILKPIKNFSFLKRRWVVALLLIVAVFVVWKQFFGGKENDQITTEVKRGTVREELILLGDVQADEHTQLTFFSPGELSWIGVEEGDGVKKGQLLARLDLTVVAANYEIALADLHAAEAMLDRVYDDIQGHDKDESFLYREIRTQAESAKDKAYRAYTIARRNLANSNIRAPFDGIVTAIAHPYGGVNVFQTEPQIEILNPDTLYFRVRVDQTEVTELFVGQRVVIVLDTFPEEELWGEVNYIGYTPKVGELGTVYLVKVILEEVPDINRIRIGMTGDAKFTLEERNNVLYLPPRFVKTDSEGRYVNLGRRNNKTYVEVGIEGEDRVEIKKGVSEEDIVFN